MGLQSDNLPHMADVVPKTTFIEDVAGFVKDRTVEEALGELQTQHQRYEYMEKEVLQRRQRLAVKEPELKKCLDAVNLLLQRREAGEESTLLDFSLSDQVYARARVSDVTSVNLWLGAGVMLEYTLEAAKELLGGNETHVAAVQELQLEGCLAQIEVAQADYDYVKDQVTTMQVSIARVYNYDVVRRKEAKA